MKWLLAETIPTWYDAHSFDDLYLLQSFPQILCSFFLIRELVYYLYI